MGRIGGGMTGDLSFDDPSGLPWLISFDEFIDGQTYQGFEEIAVRPMTTSETMLNEALALSLVGSAGEPTQRASYTSFTVNGSDATLRLLVEIPEDAYVEANFESEGVLYKSLSTGSFEYRGDDPLAYADSFKQITRKKQQDLAPLIELLRWVSEATDEEFAEQLDEYVAVDSLARYIALQEQLNNFDDMSGPGQNYYLWYDLTSERFTVLTWDLNLTFGQGFIGGVQDQMGPGGQIPGNPQNGQQRPQPPAGQTPPDAGETPQPPAGQSPPGAFETPRNTGGQGPGGGPMGGNMLKERFLASAAFEAVYTTQYAAVHDELYGSGQAIAELERLSAVISGSGLIDAATLAQETQTLRTALETAAAAGPNAP
jgi:spore coat protein CotH